MIMRVDGVSFGYRSAEVLKDVRFEVHDSELVAILGPNGVGKTTLLKCLNRILHPRGGTILVGGDELSTLPRNEVARRLGYVPQRAEVTKITVFDSVLLGRKPYITWDVSKEDLRLVGDTIQNLGLEGLALRSIDEISGGEMQKVQIARALVQEPRVLLLDEPTSSLDLMNQHMIMRSIEHAVRERGIAAVMTMHDLNLALRYADKFLLVHQGSVVAAGGLEIITSEMIERVYGLPVDVLFHKGGKVILPC